MAASQQPLMSNYNQIEGQVSNPPAVVNPNAVVIVPAVGQGQYASSNQAIATQPGYQVVPDQQYAQPGTQQVVVVPHRPAPVTYRRTNTTYWVDDNPTCIYLCAVLSLFIPIVGI